MHHICDICIEPILSVYRHSSPPKLHQGGRLRSLHGMARIYRRCRAGAVRILLGLAADMVICVFTYIKRRQAFMTVYLREYLRRSRSLRPLAGLIHRIQTGRYLLSSFIIKANPDYVIAAPATSGQSRHWHLGSLDMKMAVNNAAILFAAFLTITSPLHL